MILRGKMNSKQAQGTQTGCIHQIAAWISLAGIF